jgi:branched-chain amino acid aminotransferase
MNQAMHRYILHNEEIRDAGERVISPGQVGLLSGWGVFSTIRVYDGVMFGWERHFERLRVDAARMRVPFPSAAEEIERRLNRLIEANQAWNATLRVAIVRNQGGIWEGPGNTRDFDVVAFTANVPVWPEAVKLGLKEHGRHAASEFAGAKILSWSENLTVYERAHEQGLDEVVLLNERGEVAECTSANIFAVRTGQDGSASVWTPPLSAGCLPGVTRSVLLEEVRVPGVAIGEKILLPADLEAAPEIFITSTTRELLPVISIEGLRIGRGDAVTKQLAAAFRAIVEAYVAPRRKHAAVQN